MGGDQVRDEAEGRDAVVTDVCGGAYVLRPVAGGGEPWTVEDSAKLTVTVLADGLRWP